MARKRPFGKEAKDAGVAYMPTGEVAKTGAELVSEKSKYLGLVAVQLPANESPGLGYDSRFGSYSRLR